MLLGPLAWVHTSKPNGLDNFEPRMQVQMFEQDSYYSRCTDPEKKINKITILFNLSRTL